eukprot:1395503-Amorphochlora_amoeboformis.AAC.1
MASGDPWEFGEDSLFTGDGDLDIQAPLEASNTSSFLPSPFAIIEDLFRQRSSTRPKRRLSAPTPDSSSRPTTSPPRNAPGSVEAIPERKRSGFFVHSSSFRLPAAAASVRRDTTSRQGRIPRNANSRSQEERSLALASRRADEDLEVDLETVADRREKMGREGRTRDSKRQVVSRSLSRTLGTRRSTTSLTSGSVSSPQLHAQGSQRRGDGAPIPMFSMDEVSDLQPAVPEDYFLNEFSELDRGIPATPESNSNGLSDLELEGESAHYHNPLPPLSDRSPPLPPYPSPLPYPLPPERSVSRSSLSTPMKVR